MSDEKFDLVFKGELAKSVEKATATRNLAQLFKIELAKAELLFSGKATVLKRNLDFDVASKYRVAIKKAGALVELVPCARSAGAAQVKPQVSGQQSRPQGKAVFGARDVENDVSVAANNTPAAAEPPQRNIPEENDSSGLRVVDPAVLEQAQASRPEASPPPIEAPDFGLSAVGDDLLQASEKRTYEEAAVDVSALTLKEAEGTLLNDDEYEEFVPLPIDVEAFDIAPAGADVLKPEERKKEEVASIDVSGLSVAEAGGNLAPPKPAPPPAPDTSKITLAEDQ